MLPWKRLEIVIFMNKWSRVCVISLPLARSLERPAGIERMCEAVCVQTMAELNGTLLHVSRLSVIFIISL